MPSRFASWLAARQQVVSLGTATTADVLDGAGVFQGGVILPGLDLMRSSLARDTAQLPLADGRFDPLPRRTVDAIVSGCLHAQLGAIERMFRLVEAETGAVCLLNGGAAGSLAPLRTPLRQLARPGLRRQIPGAQAALLALRHLHGGYQSLQPDGVQQRGYQRTGQGGAREARG